MSMKSNLSVSQNYTGVLSAEQERKLAKKKGFLGTSLTKKIIIHVGLVLLCLFFMFPFIYMLNISFMTDAQTQSKDIMFFPTVLNLANYDLVFTRSFFGSLKNSLVIIVINLITVPFASALCAFGFTRCQFKGREAVFAVVLATMMLPSIAIQIPLYILYVRLNWINTVLPLTVPAALGGGAMNIFLIKQFMRGIPSSFDEAAVIDGANRFQVFLKIYLPLCTPIIIFTMIGVFNGTWNDFASPLLYLKKPDSYTLILYVYQNFTGELAKGKYPNVQMATGMMLIIPAAAVFFMFQKQLIDGVSVGGVKG